MNALLSSGEIPRSFEGDEYITLVNACQETAQRDVELLLIQMKNYITNLHFMFKEIYMLYLQWIQQTDDFELQCMTSSTLFNRCIVDWFGTLDNKGFSTGEFYHFLWYFYLLINFDIYMKSILDLLKKNEFNNLIDWKRIYYSNRYRFN